MFTVLEPDTTSSEAIYATLRNAFLGYIHPSSGRRLSDIIAERLYVSHAPSPPMYPYMTMLLSGRQTMGAYNGYRETANLELQCIGRPESQGPFVEEAGDLCDQAFLGYRQPRDGLIFSRSRIRSTLPPFTEPADIQVVGIVIMVPVVIWPRYLTDLRPSPQ